MNGKAEPMTNEERARKFWHDWYNGDAPGDLYVGNSMVDDEDVRSLTTLLEQVRAEAAPAYVNICMACGRCHKSSAMRCWTEKDIDIHTARVEELEAALVDAYDVFKNASEEWRLRPASRAVILQVKARRLSGRTT
jgi:hypothetical protein